jgi:hypothetical protein
MDETPRPLITAPGACGCLAAAVFVLLTGTMYLFVWAWTGAHCRPPEDCSSSWLDIAWPLVVLLLVAIPLGFATRAVVRALVKRWGPVRGVVIGLAAGLALAWLGVHLLYGGAAGGWF